MLAGLCAVRDPGVPALNRRRARPPDARSGANARRVFDTAGFGCGAPPDTNRGRNTGGVGLNRVADSADHHDSPLSRCQHPKTSRNSSARREKSETCGTQQAKELSMSPLETRQSLIVRLKSAQNELAWRDFVCTYEVFLNQLARRQGVPERHIPDVTQQILLTIARSIDGWKDDGNVASFRRWLSTVARNVVIRFMARERKQAGGIGGSELLAQLQNVEDKPEQKYIQRYQHELVVWAAEQVRHEFLDTSWRAFWATVIEEKSVDEVAAEIKVTPGSIYMSRSRIMARIRKKVAEVENDQ